MIRNVFSVERGILVAIILGYVVLGALYAALTPAWQVPDEPAHYNYVRYLVQERRLPILRMGDYDQAYLEEIKEQRFPPDRPIDSIRYEYHQPPLYYLGLAPIYALSGGALLPLRLASVALGAGVLLIIYLVGKALYPDRAWPALGMTAFAAFIPQHIAMTAGVENDVLAELLLGIILLRLIRWLQADEPASLWQYIGTGVVIGLVLLTKTTGYIAVPLAVVAAVLRFWRTSPSGQRRLDVRPTIEAVSALLLPALLISLPWFIRNAVVYGDLDFTGLKWHDQVVVGQLRASEWVDRFGWVNWPSTFTRTTFRSLWAQFGWMAVPIDWRIYTALRMISVVAAVGFVFRAADAWEARRWPSTPLILLFCSGLLTLGAYLWYNLSFYQAQGRYLFPALIPLGLAWTLGLRESLHSKNARWIGAVLALVTAYDAYHFLAHTSGAAWKTLIHGAGTAFVGVKILLPERFDNWLFTVPHLLLAALCTVSPFWFIIPFLS